MGSKVDEMSGRAYLIETLIVNAGPKAVNFLLYIEKPPTGEKNCLIIAAANDSQM